VLLLPEGETLDIIHSFILGVVQGVTEFLPISSSAHLVLLPQILRLKSGILNSLTFDVVLHFGTLLAVLVYYRKKVADLFTGFFKGIFNPCKRNDPDFKLSIFLIIATIPASLAGYFLNEFAEKTFREPVLVAIVLIVFAFVLLFADKNKNFFKEINQMTIKDALIIGCFQAIAIIPGVSRSGITISLALFLGFKRDEAAEFSFLLSIPVILGAFFFKVGDVFTIGIGENVAVLITGIVSSFVAGFIAILFLINFVKKHSFLPFVIYRILLGLTIIGLFIRV
jgi:undecaprenyl-diphosphatase